MEMHIYLIAFDFGNYGLKQLPTFIRDEGNAGTWNEIANPRFATVFKTKKKAKEWIDNNMGSTKEYAKIVKKYDAVKAFIDTINSEMLHSKRPRASAKWNMKYDSSIHTLDDVIEFFYDSPEVDMEVYKSWPKLYSVSNHISSTKSVITRNSPTGYAKTFEIYSSSDGKFEEFKAEIEKIIDKVTHVDEDGMKVLCILDHFLCENGNSVILHYEPTSGYCEIEGDYFADTYDTLEGAFDYIRRERYYNN